MKDFRDALMHARIAAYSMAGDDEGKLMELSSIYSRFHGKDEMEAAALWVRLSAEDKNIALDGLRKAIDDGFGDDGRRYLAVLEEAT